MKHSLTCWGDGRHQSGHDGVNAAWGHRFPKHGNLPVSRAQTSAYRRPTGCGSYRAQAKGPVWARYLFNLLGDAPAFGGMALLA